LVEPRLMPRRSRMCCAIAGSLASAAVRTGAELLVDRAFFAVVQ
jgi:hypothetical protein